MSENTDSVEAHRRAVVKRIFSDAAARGQPVDSDPQFAKWVDEWIAGTINANELRRRYSDLRTQRLSANRSRRDQPKIRSAADGAPTDSLLDEISRLTYDFEEEFRLPHTDQAM